MDTAERLFVTYHATLVRYLTRRLGDRDWAEEVAQETFVRALRQEGAMVNERAWVFAVAHNLVRDGARRDARNRRHLELMAAEVREEESTDDEQTDERAERLRMARQALATLTEKDRQALLPTWCGQRHRRRPESRSARAHSGGDREGALQPWRRQTWISFRLTGTFWRNEPIRNWFPPQNNNFVRARLRLRVRDGPRPIRKRIGEDGLVELCEDQQARRYRFCRMTCYDGDRAIRLMQ